VRDHVLDMRTIVDALTSAGIPAEVEQSVGGVATIYAGPASRRFAIGPGRFSQERPLCDSSELSMGPEDGSVNPVSLAVAELVRHVTEALPVRWPSPCTSEVGLDCENPDHDHRYDATCDPDGDQAHIGDELACTDCGGAMFWDEATQVYWHTDRKTEPCFLLPEQM
jgi:hypothetical protein